MLLFLFWLVLCGVAAWIGADKGRSGLGFFVTSFFLSPVVGIIAAIGCQPRAPEVKVYKDNTGLIPETRTVAQVYGDVRIEPRL